MSQQPNVLLIVMDSVRAANLSCYGYDRATTPHIDAVASQGTRYEQCITQGCWTLPVHVSLFTGLYPSAHGINTSEEALAPEVETLPALLSQQGYDTICLSNNPYVSELNGLVGGFDTVQDLWKTRQSRGRGRTRSSKLIKRLEKYRPFTSPALAAIRKLKQHRQLKKRLNVRDDNGAAQTNEQVAEWLSRPQAGERPFFMFINFMECHEPYNPPQPYDRRFMAKGFSSMRVAEVSAQTAADGQGGSVPNPDDVEILRSLYDGELSYLDEKIGELLGVLETRGILDDTVVILTSDHGDSLGEHDRFGHRVELYEPLVHVPLIVRYPERFAASQCVQQHVELIDLYHTIRELTGTDTTGSSSERAFSLLNLPPMDERPYTFAENTAPKAFDSVVARMVRSNRYKYINQSDGQNRLYDLEADADELNNLIESRPEIAAAMEAALVKWRDSQQEPIAAPAGAEHDEVVVGLLRDLGYLN